MPLIVCILAFCLACAAMSGQTITFENEPPLPLAATNVSKLEVSLRMDRAIYIPGEIASLTVSVRNPTGQALEVVNPFWPKGGWYRSSREAWGEENSVQLPRYKQSSPAEPYSNGRLNATSTILLSPGETITQSVRTDERPFSGLPLLPWSGVPLRPGDSRLAYNYGGARADFEVVQPMLEQHTAQPVSQVRVGHPGGPSAVASGQIHAFVVTVGGRRLVLRSVGVPKTCPGLQRHWVSRIALGTSRVFTNSNASPNWMSR